MLTLDSSTSFLLCTFLSSLIFSALPCAYMCYVVNIIYYNIIITVWLSELVKRVQHPKIIIECKKYYISLVSPSLFEDVSSPQAFSENFMNHDAYQFYFIVSVQSMRNAYTDYLLRVVCIFVESCCFIALCLRSILHLFYATTAEMMTMTWSSNWSKSPDSCHLLLSTENYWNYCIRLLWEIHYHVNFLFFSNEACY